MIQENVTSCTKPASTALDGAKKHELFCVQELKIIWKSVNFLHLIFCAQGKGLGSILKYPCTLNKQPYTKNYRQLRDAESRRNTLPREECTNRSFNTIRSAVKTYMKVILYKVYLGIYIYIKLYICAWSNNLKSGYKFGGVQGGWIGWIWRRKQKW